MKTYSLTSTPLLVEESAMLKGGFLMKTEKPEGTKELSPKQKKELSALSKQSDAQIDYSDIPALTEDELKNMQLRYFKVTPVKTRISILIDADVLAAFKQAGK